MAKARNNAGFWMLSVVFLTMAFVIAVGMCITMYVKWQQTKEEIAAYPNNTLVPGESDLRWGPESIPPNTDFNKIFAYAKNNNTTAFQAAVTMLNAQEEATAALDTNYLQVIADKNTTARELASLQEETRISQGRATEAEAQMDSAISETEAVRADLRAREQELRADIARLETEKESIQQDLTERLQETSDNYNESVDELTAEVTAYQALIDTARTEIEDLEAVIESEAYTPNSLVTHADGQVRSALSDDMVYINIGTNDRVRAGYTFEVLGQNDTVIQLDEVDENGVMINLEFAGVLHGKATLEVIRVEDGMSLARVVRREEGAVVEADDYIANLAFDANREFRFFVFGDIDLDDTGNARQYEIDAERVRAMIENYGADYRTVSSEALSSDEEVNLPLTTNYLVLGEEPEEPIDPGQFASVPEVNAYTADLRRYEIYMALQAQARMHGVTVLDVNRFSDMMGYSRR